ncbi:hypothetical protein FACS189437_03020 [Bacteroidia bacterium]|nr:hypothetical protein FACS189437_03020 [Bacteroidia bacterium]
MKILRGYILLSGCVFLLSGCGLDIGQIYIQIKKAGGWRQFSEQSQHAAAQKADGLNLMLPGVYMGQASRPSAAAELYDEQKKYIEMVKSDHGDEAAKEVEAELRALNAALVALALEAKNEKDFITKQQKTENKYSENIKAIILKYSK